MNNKLLAIFGTRPEAIKMASVLTLLRKTQKHTVKICVTAQHRQMLDQCLTLFNLTADYDLDLMVPNQDLSQLSSKILQGVSEVIAQEKPDRVLVQGDTTTALMGALAAYYHKIPVAHIEAGLRSYDLYAPWPEEGNRKLVSALADIHFAPTQVAAEQLLSEGIAAERIFVTGNTVIDALQETCHLLEQRDDLTRKMQEQFSFLDPQKKLILVTGHRRENFGHGFQQIGKALAQLALRNDVQIVYPVHLNPNVQKPVQELLSHSPSIFLLEPLDYLPFVYLMKQAYLVLTDSGGIQEEAPALGKPVLVLRDVTERPEGIAAGVARLAGTQCDQIIAETTQLLDDPAKYAAMNRAVNPYGDGQAAQRILDILEKM